jgi:hypothetical protein
MQLRLQILLLVIRQRVQARRGRSRRRGMRPARRRLVLAVAAATRGGRRGVRGRGGRREAVRGCGGAVAVRREVTSEREQRRRSQGARRQGVERQGGTNSSRDASWDTHTPQRHGAGRHAAAKTPCGTSNTICLPQQAVSSSAAVATLRTKPLERLQTLLQEHWVY